MDAQPARAGIEIQYIPNPNNNNLPEPEKIQYIPNPNKKQSFNKNFFTFSII